MTAPIFTRIGKAHGAKATYQWYVGGKLVTGANWRYVLVKPEYRNRSIVVKVTVTATGYQPMSRRISFGLPS